MQKKLTGILALLALILSSCTLENACVDGTRVGAWMADVEPLSPAGSRSLRAYAMTLPIFEMTSREARRQWVEESTPRGESRDHLVLIGMGAQSNISIQRLTPVDAPEQSIRLTIEGEEITRQPEEVRELTREQGGWRLTAVSHDSIEWDDLLRQAAQAKP